DDVLAPFCSGTIVAPRVVLTAAHCFEGKRPGAPYEVFLGDDVAKGGELHAVEKIVLPTGYDGGNGAGDLAILILDSPASATPVTRGSLAAGDDGKPVKMAGFGITEDGGGIGTKRSGSGSITSIDSGDFRIGPSPSMTCQGDSGGPIFLGSDLVGVTSYGDPGCTTFADNARVDVASAFIDDAIASVADAGSGADAGAPTGICSGTCTSAEQCAAGFDCNVGEDGTGQCSLSGLPPGDFGAACTTDDTCASHTCARYGSSANACACLAPCAAIPPEPDAAAPTADASTSDAPPPSDDGCSCRSTGNPAGSDVGGFGVLALFALAFARVSGRRRANAV
ncbi:MAG TPA: trypsin-like serine protease, partial [Polyangiaceae bacterium]